MLDDLHLAVEAVYTNLSKLSVKADSLPDSYAVMHGSSKPKIKR